jgi:hypothetical protein
VLLLQRLLTNLEQGRTTNIFTNETRGVSLGVLVMFVFFRGRECLNMRRQRSLRQKYAGSKDASSWRVTDCKILRARPPPYLHLPPQCFRLLLMYLRCESLLHRRLFGPRRLFRALLRLHAKRRETRCFLLKGIALLLQSLPPS